MRRIALVIVALVVVLLVASQLVLPPLAQHATSDRLTRDGGSADVTIKAFPALRLLFGHGDSLTVEGEDIRLPSEPQKDSFGRLNKFDEVRIHLHDTEAGPVTIREFVLERPEGADTYSARISARTTPRDIARYVGGVFGDLAAGATLPGGGSVPLPVNVTATVDSRDGRREVSDVTGAVAGVPAGPLVELVLDAVVRRL